MTHPLRVWLALSLAAATLLTLPQAAPAQRPAPAQGASADPDLSPAQKARMTARQAQIQKAVAALRADPALTPAQKQAKFRTLAQAADKDMMAILTPPQRALLLKQRQITAQFKTEVEALRADRTLTDQQKQARYQTLLQKSQSALLATLPPTLRTKVEKEHQAEMARAAEANKVSAELQKSLSKKAQEQIRQVTLETRAKMKAVVADATLSPAAKAARLRELGQEDEARISAFLDPKQRALFAKYHQIISAAPHR